jgi:hypothetical protein
MTIAFFIKLLYFYENQTISKSDKLHYIVQIFLDHSRIITG